MHSDREHQAALTSATGYIVVFKKTATKEEVQGWKDEIVKGSEYLKLHMGSSPAHRASAMVVEGKVTHEYGTVLNGFAAEIAPETSQLLSQSVTDGGPIAYIGVCVPRVCGLSR
jgi:Peptidase inhibitor I9